MIKSLNSFRFIFIFVIFVHHFGLFPGGGSLGVTFFFVLSGFILALSYGDKIESNIISKKNFFIKRISKIYPLHVALWCIFVVSAITSGYMSLRYVFAGFFNLFLLQSWIPITKVCMSYNAVSWFLSDMVFFYAIFPSIISPIMRNNLKNNILLLLIIILLNLVLWIVIPTDIVQRTIYVNPLVRLSDFVLGIILYKIYKSLKIEIYVRQLSYHRIWLVYFSEIVVLLSIVLYVIYIADNKSFSNYSIFYWLPISVLIIQYTVNERINRGGYVLKILKFSVLQKLGTISFSFYLLHAMIIKISQQISEKLNYDPHSMLVFIVAFSATLCAAFICYYFFELPISRYLNSKFVKLSARTDSLI